MESTRSLKKILIISPHFPPSNLVGAHRARFFAKHLPSYGWEPIIMTVKEKYYEGTPDRNLEKLLPAGLRIEKVDAMRITKPRVIGDIGLRSFRSMYRAAKKIIRNEQIDFLYITIPSFYGAIWGRMLHSATGIKYGIDYQDPWVHEFAGSNRLFSRHWFAEKIARLLEPVAIKHASLITGVAEGYYAQVIERNPGLTKICHFAALPIGTETDDHEQVKLMDVEPYLFDRNSTKIKLVYAGAMLPKAYPILEAVFKAISNAPEIYENIEFHFIGTGKTTNDPNGFNIKPMAERYGLWKKNIFEYPTRIPYLDVLIHLNAADGIFVLGSTEAHYTPSKIYQGILSKKPILVILHNASTAIKVLKETGAGMVIEFKGENDIDSIGISFNMHMQNYLEWMKQFNTANINYEKFDKYLVKNITAQLAHELNGLFI